MPVTAKIAISHVITKNNDEIWRFSGLQEGQPRDCQNCQQKAVQGIHRRKA
jgi:hypothetical protein